VRVSVWSQSNFRLLTELLCRCEGCKRWSHEGDTFVHHPECKHCQSCSVDQPHNLASHVVHAATNGIVHPDAMHQQPGALAVSCSTPYRDSTPPPQGGQNDSMFSEVETPRQCRQVQYTFKSPAKQGPLPVESPILKTAQRIDLQCMC
jgi:hypothetical protein